MGVVGVQMWPWPSAITAICGRSPIADLQYTAENDLDKDRSLWEAEQHGCNIVVDFVEP